MIDKVSKPAIKRKRKSLKGERVRDAILDATAELMKTIPAASISIDVIAAKAEITKGGLLHHFESKDELFRSLVQRVLLIDKANQVTFGENIASKAQDEVEFILNHVDRSFLATGTAADTTKTLMAIAAYDPRLLEPVREFFAEQSERIIDNSVNPYGMMILIALAAGIYAHDAIGVPLFEGRLRNKVREAAMALARQMMTAEGGTAIPKKQTGRTPIPSRARRAREDIRASRSRNPRNRAD
ncbi:MAG: TetR/AcrR family transcriptional regulator [Novosphingobium sp.]